MASMPQSLPQRYSFANRISSLFERRRAPTQDVESARATTTFEVPLFLSPTRFEPPQAHRQDWFPEDTRSRSSTQSLIEAASSIADRVRPLTLPSSSRYSSPASTPLIHQPPRLPIHEQSHLESASSTTGGNPSSTESSRPAKDVHQRRRRRRRSSLKVKMAALKRLNVVFGLTLLATLITYLALAVTGTATGIMFHVLMILFILSLTGVVAHSALRLFFLSKSTNERRVGRRHNDHWHGRSATQAGSYFGEVQTDVIDHHDEHPPEKPIRIIMADDEAPAIHPRIETLEVKPPPPVYGNTRSSKRINPNLVHWQHVPPSPLTPTYDEAMSDVHRVVGYRPPSYIASDSGVTYVVDQGTRDVDSALKYIHPLERERMVALGQNMI